MYLKSVTRQKGYSPAVNGDDALQSVNCQAKGTPYLLRIAGAHPKTNASQPPLQLPAPTLGLEVQLAASASFHDHGRVIESRPRESKCSPALSPLSLLQFLPTSTPRRCCTSDRLSAHDLLVPLKPPTELHRASCLQSQNPCRMAVKEAPLPIPSISRHK